MESTTESMGGMSRLDELINEVVSAEEPQAGSQAMSAAPTDASALLSGLMGNADWLSVLPQLISTAAPLLGSLGGSGGTNGSGRGLRMDRHTALLCAIKPYLCAERQKAADQLISLCKMGDALQKMPKPHPTAEGEGHV